MVQYGDTTTVAPPDSDAGNTDRYEEARAAAHRAMSNITISPATPQATGVIPATSVGTPLPTEPVVDPELLSYRGFKFGAAFFGWLISIAMSVLLLAAASAAALGSAEVLDYSWSDAKAEPGAAAITAAAVAVCMLILAFYAGGYVAGRLARFDGGRQGFGAWMIALVLMVLAAGGGWFLNHQYDLLDEISRPDVALSNDTLAMGGAIAAGAVLVLTLLAAIVGGKSGKRYHDRIDRLLD